MIRFSQFITESKVVRKAIKKYNEDKRNRDEYQEHKKADGAERHARIHGHSADESFKKEYEQFRNSDTTNTYAFRQGFYLYFVVYPAPVGGRPMFYVGIKHTADADINDFWGSIRFDHKGDKKHHVTKPSSWEPYLIRGQQRSKVGVAEKIPQKAVSRRGDLYMSSSKHNKDKNSLGRALIKGLLVNQRYHPYILNNATLRNLLDFRKVFGRDDEIFPAPSNKLVLNRDEYKYEVHAIDQFHEFPLMLEKMIKHQEDLTKEGDVPTPVLKIIGEIYRNKDYRDDIRELFSDAAVKHVQKKAKEFYEGRQLTVPPIFAKEENYRYFISNQMKRFPHLLIGAAEAYVSRQKDKSGDKSQKPGTAALLPNEFIFDGIYVPSEDKLGIDSKVREDLLVELLKSERSKKTEEELKDEERNISLSHFMDFDGEEEGNEKYSINNLLQKGNKSHSEVLARLSFFSKNTPALISRPFGLKIQTENGNILSSPIHKPFVDFFINKKVENGKSLKKYFEAVELPLLDEFVRKSLNIKDMIFSFKETTKTSDKDTVRFDGGDDGEDRPRRRRRIGGNKEREKEVSRLYMFVKDMNKRGQVKRREIDANNLNLKELQQRESLEPFTLYDFLSKLGYKVDEKDTVESFQNRLNEDVLYSILEDLEEILLENHEKAMSGGDPIINNIFHRLMPDRYKKYYHKTEIAAPGRDQPLFRALPEPKELKDASSAEIRRELRRIRRVADYQRDPGTLRGPVSTIDLSLDDQLSTNQKIELHKRMMGNKNKWDKIGFEFFLHTITTKKLNYGGFFFENLDGNVRKVTKDEMQKILVHIAGYDLLAGGEDNMEEFEPSLLSSD